MSPAGEGADGHGAMLPSVRLSWREMEKLQVVHHQLSQNGLGRDL